MPEKPDKKKRLSVYLDPDLMRMLADFADRREQSRSLIAEAAIASFLSPDADERQEAATVKRLERIDRNIPTSWTRCWHCQRSFCHLCSVLVDLDTVATRDSPGGGAGQGRRAI
jgi:predicted transcriptional regulator